MIEGIAYLVTKRENVVRAIGGSRYSFNVKMFTSSLNANDGIARDVAGGKETLTSTRDVSVCSVDLPCEIPIVTESATIHQLRLDVIVEMNVVQGCKSTKITRSRWAKGSRGIGDSSGGRPGLPARRRLGPKWFGDRRLLGEYRGT
jgi:hypothetical protein